MAAYSKEEFEAKLILMNFDPVQKEINLRGVPKARVLYDLHNFFEWAEKKDVGPITTGAIAKWRAEGGLLDQLIAASSGEDMLDILKTATGKGEDSYPFIMDCMYNALMPCALSAEIRQGDNGAAQVIQGLTNEICKWGGFSLLGGRFHVMTGIDHEINEYLTKAYPVVAQDTNMLFSRFNRNAFATPFSNFGVMLEDGSDVAIANARKAIGDYAAKLKMRDHFAYAAAEGGRLTLCATAGFAQRILKEDMGESECGIVGLTTGAAFLPRTPKA